MSKLKIYIKGKDNATLVKVNISPELIGAYSPQRRVELPPELWADIVKAAKRGSTKESKSYTFIVSYSDTKELGVSAEYRLEPKDKDLLSPELIEALDLDNIFNNEHTHTVDKKKKFNSFPVYIQCKLTKEESKYALERNITKDVFVRRLFTFNPLCLFKERIIRRVYDRTKYSFKAYATNPIPVLQWYNVYIELTEGKKTITMTKIEPSFVKLLINYFKK